MCIITASMLNRNATAVTVNNHLSLSKLLVVLGGALPAHQTSGIRGWRKVGAKTSDAGGDSSLVENIVLRAVSQILAARTTENGEGEARVKWTDGQCNWIKIIHLNVVGQELANDMLVSEEKSHEKKKRKRDQANTNRLRKDRYRRKCNSSNCFSVWPC